MYLSFERSRLPKTTISDGVGVAAVVAADCFRLLCNGGSTTTQLYGIVMRTIDMHDTDIPENVKEFWSKSLAKRLPEEWLRKVTHPHRKAPATQDL
jgi:hypothetical protein